MDASVDAEMPRNKTGWKVATNAWPDLSYRTGESAEFNCLFAKQQEYSSSAPNLTMLTFVVMAVNLKMPGRAVPFSSNLVHSLNIHFWQQMRCSLPIIPRWYTVYGSPCPPSKNSLQMILGFDRPPHFALCWLRLRTQWRERSHFTWSSVHFIVSLVMGNK